MWRLDSSTVAAVALALLVTVALGAWAGDTDGPVSGLLASLAGVAGSALLGIATERRSQQMSRNKRRAELLEKFAPPKSSGDGKDSEQS